VARSPNRKSIVATILLAEDNRDVADMIALALELEGHVVHVAYDGTAALREAARLRPDAAILDIGLPKLDGIELAHALRQMHGEGVTLIACTGMADGLLGARVAGACFDHVLVKPVSVDTLLGAVQDRRAPVAASRTPARERAGPAAGLGARHTGP
jgi:DNA-binding response OmpR family regulator